MVLIPTMVLIPADLHAAVRHTAGCSRDHRRVLTVIHYLTPTRPATPQAVHSAEVALGIRLPEQYRRYLLTQAN